MARMKEATTERPTVTVPNMAAGAETSTDTVLALATPVKRRVVFPEEQV
jgi:hypothetical protein